MIFTSDELTFSIIYREVWAITKLQDVQQGEQTGLGLMINLSKHFSGAGVIEAHGDSLPAGMIRWPDSRSYVSVHRDILTAHVPHISCGQATGQFTTQTE